MADYTEEQRAFLRKLWPISPELHDAVAKMMRDGFSIERVKEALRDAVLISRR